MEEYFTTTLNKLRSYNYNTLNIVLGNESCDLDSAISSIVYAIFLNWQYQQIKCKNITKENLNSDYKDDIFVPVLNVDREDFGLKTEVVHLLKEYGITESLLVFRNDFDLNQLITKSKTNVVLVDHHNMSAKDKFLAPYVTEIIDHRPIDKTGWSYKDDTRSTLKVVGSCCTLIAQRVKDLSALVAKDVDFFSAYPACSHMLHTTIILDTVNFSKELNKATPHDEEIVQFLESLIKPNDYEIMRKNELERMLKAKSNVGELNAAQLLKKDLKIFGNIMVPSFPILVEEFLQKPNSLETVSSVMAQNECNVTVLLGMDLKNGLKRDTAVFSAVDLPRASELSTFLQEWSNPPFNLIPAESSNKNEQCFYFKQNNLSATRKQYVPAITAFLITN